MLQRAGCLVALGDIQKTAAVHNVRETFRVTRESAKQLASPEAYG